MRWNACHFLTEFSLTGPGRLMTNKLPFRSWVLAFGQTCKVLIACRLRASNVLKRGPWVY